MDVLVKIERTCKKVMNVYICDKYKDEWLVGVHEALTDAKCEIIANREKDDKHRWHDLRKNPNDIPEVGGCYLVYRPFARDGVYSVCYGDEAGIWFDNYTYDVERLLAPLDVYAWKYIEPFEEVE